MTQNSEHTPAPADVDPTVAEIAEDIVTEDAAPVAPEQTFADFGVHPRSSRPWRPRASSTPSPSRP